MSSKEDSSFKTVQTSFSMKIPLIKGIPEPRGFIFNVAVVYDDPPIAEILEPNTDLKIIHNMNQQRSQF